MSDRLENPVIEKAISSRGAMRILELLSRRGDLNISEITRRLGLNHANVQRHIGVLTEAGILKESRYGRVKIISLIPREVRISFIRGEGLRVELIG